MSYTLHNGLLVQDKPKRVHRLPKRLTRDTMMTFDARTIDSTGAFLVGELERMDQTLHEPLYSVKWHRDIKLRGDVSIGDEVSSFTRSTFAAAGGINPNGIAWIGKDSNQIANIAVDIGKENHPLRLVGYEIGYSLPELNSAIRLGRPVDAQKHSGMKIKHEMDTDQVVYIGDPTTNPFTGDNASAAGFTGLLNNTDVDTDYVEADGSGSATNWDTKTPQQMVRDINDMLYASWAASGFKMVPNWLLMPPQKLSKLNSTVMTIGSSGIGSVSVLKFLMENNLCLQEMGVPLNIHASKWLNGLGVPVETTATDRMAAYTNDEFYIRFPMVPLQSTPLEYRSLYHLTTYYGLLGEVEFVYPETVIYRDGI